MAAWRGKTNKFLHSFRNYKEPECITNYNKFEKEIKRQIAELYKNNPTGFCRNCQKIKQDIINKNDQLKVCYTLDLLRNKLIDDFEINAFMEKCLEPRKCRYNRASNVRNPPALKVKSENSCGGRNDCNKGEASAQVLANKVQQKLNHKSPETNLPARQDDLNIKQPHAEVGRSTKANSILGLQKNISITNQPIVVQPGAPHSKGIDPSGTLGQVYILEQPISASQHSLHSELGNSSNDSSSQVTPASESSLTSIYTEGNLETSSHESNQRSLQHVNGNSLGAQELESATAASQDHDTGSLDFKISAPGGLDKRPPNGEDGTVRTHGGENHATDVIHNLVDSIILLGGTPSPYSTLTHDAAGGENYLNGASLETLVDVPVSDDPIGDNSETPFKKYTAMALAPTGIIMLMTLLTKFTPLGMLFTKKNRNKRNDMKENIERILLLESPAKTEESSYSFAYSPSQYWET
ncbi:PIR protein [Plasmodium vivax]|uniref:VIR protein n=2 Tax=Plasmodium vivax TaxID=5855 RepID=A0A564ZR66_PLAVI|nr:PIR protein [Plasmodium vivax]